MWRLLLAIVVAYTVAIQDGKQCLTIVTWRQFHGKSTATRRRKCTTRHLAKRSKLFNHDTEVVYIDILFLIVVLKINLRLCHFLILSKSDDIGNVT
jgi:hypothetical protein